jgi:magnesium chelatase family protein
MPEFRREVLEVLRQPLEDGIVTISRALSTLTFPAKFMLLGALNPCKCGYLNDPYRECSCHPEQVQRYLSKISGPLLDRIDLQFDVPRLKESDLHQYADDTTEKSVVVRQRVIAARRLQYQRLGDCQIFCNANMLNQHIKQFCQLRPEGTQLLERASHKFRFSGRVFHRILKVARTIADLSDHQLIEAPDVAEAIQYRGFSESQSFS